MGEKITCGLPCPLSEEYLMKYAMTYNFETGELTQPDGTIMKFKNGL